MVLLMIRFQVPGFLPIARNRQRRGGEIDLGAGGKRQQAEAPSSRATQLLSYLSELPFHKSDKEGKLLLRAARTQRCAREGKLVLGLTKHVPILARAGCGINTFCSLFPAVWPQATRAGT